MARRKDGAAPAGARRRLGRGLESLISSPVKIDLPTQPPSAEAGGKQPPAPVQDQASKAPTEAPQRPLVQMLALESVQPNARQPRRTFDEESLRNLAQSIESAGLMQPIVVRPRTEGGYEIVAGERRWRAAHMIGLREIPAVVRDIDDRTATQWSLVENLQREDLNPLERAEAFRRLIDEFGLTHQEVAQRVGLDRSSVTNHLRLMELDEFTQDALRHGRIGMGHGRALLAITNLEGRQELARQAVARGMSVRELERRIRRRQRADAAPAPGGPVPQKAHLQDLQRRLGEHLGTKVLIQSGRKKGSGKLVISFYSLDEFEGLLRRIGFQYD
jgi:ParB family chromosome partitioning protein